MTVHGAVRTTILPWIGVRGGLRALAFYKAAFGAVEVYRFDGPDDTVVARLSVDGAEFWVADESEEPGSSVRMILTVADPDGLFARAIEAGARVVNPVSEDHGWRVGRLTDPFGHDWEIGREV